MKKYIIAAVLFLILSGTYTVSASAEGTIEQGISIEGHDVSGMTQAEAQQVVDTYVEELQSQVITFSMDSNTQETTTPQALGFDWSNRDVAQQAFAYGKSGNIVSRYKQKKDLENQAIDLPIGKTFNEEAVRSFIEEDCGYYKNKAQDISLKRENGFFQIIQGSSGMEIDTDASVASTIDYLTNEWKGDAPTVTLVMKEILPKGDEEQLRAVQDELGSASTDYSASSDARAKNVENAVGMINGTTLYPGESFSMLDEVMPFDEQNGYAKAPSYANGKVVESYGGGICQVSTTLYMSVLRSELEVDQRSPHSMLVKYVRPSWDAAIAEGSKDLVFTNNTEYPIYIDAQASGGTISFVIYGKEYREANRTVDYESRTISEDKEELKAELWKTVTVDGTVTETTKVNSSTYQLITANQEETSQDSD